MKQSVLLRRPLLAAGMVVATIVLVSTITLAVLNLRHVKASGTGPGGGNNACLYTGGDPACSFSGAGAQAGYYYADPNGHVYTSTYIFVADNVLHNQPGAPAPAPQVTVFIYSYDSYTGYSIVDEWGGTSNINFKHDSSLQSASLDAAVPVTDYISGSTRTITISLTWKGYGDTSSFVDNSQFRSEHVMFRSRFSGDDRRAMASGTVSDGTTNFVSGPGYSSLYSFKAGTIDIFH